MAHQFLAIIIEHPLRYIAIWVSFLVIVPFIAIVGTKKSSSICLYDLKQNFSYSPNIVALFFFLMGVFVSLIPAWSALTFYDADHLYPLIDSSARWLPPPIWPELGRFFPLADQEFRYINLLFPTIYAFHALSVIQILVIALLLRSISGGRYWLISAAMAMSSVSFVEPFFGLIYPERNLVFFLVVTIFCIQRWESTGGLTYVFFGLLCANLLIFYKEIGFIFPGAIGSLGVMRFLRGKSSIRTPIIYLSLFFTSFLWLLFYVIEILPEIVSVYRPIRSATIQDAFGFASMQTWFYLIVVMFIARLMFVVKKGTLLDPIMDGCILGALLYVSALIILKYDSPYYYSPAAIVAFGLFARVFPSFMNSKIFRSLMPCAIFLLNAPASIEHIVRWKELIAAKSDAAAFIGMNPANKNISIHYPGESSYVAGLFSGYISSKYKSRLIAVVHDTSSTGASSCTSSINMPVCHYNTPYRPGDLVVSFGKPAAHEGLSLLYISSSIGWWRNSYFVYVYKVIG